MKSAALGSFALALVAMAGCAADKSFALVSVLSTSGQFNGVTQLLVDVTNAPFQDHLAYPKMPAPATAAFRFDDAQPLTFSVGFKTAHRGTLVVAVTPLDGADAVMGYGVGMAEILADTVTNVTVRVVAGALPPARTDGGVDGSMSDDGGRADRTGVDVTLCDPISATSCGPNHTCYVTCHVDQSATMCIASGTKKVGELCAGVEDCVPGTQCLESPCGKDRPGVKTCVQFCKSNEDCGGEAKCNDSLCMNQVEVCSRPCDPLETATTGCAAGLNCFLGTNETPSCYCNGVEGVGSDGEMCTTSNDCKPGFLCVTMSGASKCRKLCRIADKDKAGVCPPGATCTVLTDPNYTTFGGCVPSAP